MLLPTEGLKEEKRVMHSLINICRSVFIRKAGKSRRLQGDARFAALMRGNGQIPRNNTAKNSFRVSFSFQQAERRSSSCFSGRH